MPAVFGTRAWRSSVSGFRSCGSPSRPPERTMSKGGPRFVRRWSPSTSATRSAMNQFFNFSQFMLIAAFMAMAAGSWIFGQIRQQAARKRARAEARRRYEEQLRTGRPPEEPAGPQAGAAAQGQPMSPGQRLAAQRQAQLQQLRQRQATPTGGTSGVGAGPSAPPPLVRSPQTPMARPTGRPPSGVVIQRIPPAAAPQPRQRPSRPQPVRPTGRGVPRPGAAPVRPRPVRSPRPAGGPSQAPASPRGERPQRRERPRERVGALVEAPAPGTGAREGGTPIHASVRALLLGHSTSRVDRAQQLRTLIAATEVLSPPVSLREDGRMAGDAI